MVADALTRTREGTIDTWAEPGSVPPAHDIDDADNMLLWAPVIRAAVIDFELLSRLRFGRTGAETVLFSHTAQSGDPMPLVSLTRPPVEVFRSQLTLIDSYAELRPERATEILAQLTPPYAFLASVLALHPDRTRFTLELFDTTLRLANVVAQRCKHALACRRPVELSPSIQPMIQTPAHGSLPSGHATEAFALALVGTRLLAAAGRKDVVWPRQLMRLASRIAVNRTVAGVHFPVDSMAGCLLGLTIGSYLVARCTGAGRYAAWGFDGAALSPRADFDWTGLFDESLTDQKADGSVVVAIGPQDDPALGSPILSWLWARAVAEWP